MEWEGSTREDCSPRILLARSLQDRLLVDALNRNAETSGLRHPGGEHRQSSGKGFRWDLEALTKGRQDSGGGPAQKRRREEEE